MLKRENKGILFQNSLKLCNKLKKMKNKYLERDLEKADEHLKEFEEKAKSFITELYEFVRDAVNDSKNIIPGDYDYIEVSYLEDDRETIQKNLLAMKIRKCDIMSELYFTQFPDLYVGNMFDIGADLCVQKDHNKLSPILNNITESDIFKLVCNSFPGLYKETSKTGYLGTSVSLRELTNVPESNPLTIEDIDEMYNFISGCRVMYNKDIAIIENQITKNIADVNTKIGRMLDVMTEKESTPIDISFDIGETVYYILVGLFLYTRLMIDYVYRISDSIIYRSNAYTTALSSAYFPKDERYNYVYTKSNIESLIAANHPCGIEIFPDAAVIDIVLLYEHSNTILQQYSGMVNAIVKCETDKIRSLFKYSGNTIKGIINAIQSNIDYYRTGMNPEDMYAKLTDYNEGLIEYIDTIHEIDESDEVSCKDVFKNINAIAVKGSSFINSLPITDVIDLSYADGEGDIDAIVSATELLDNVNIIVKPLSTVSQTDKFFTCKAVASLLGYFLVFTGYNLLKNQGMETLLTFFNMIENNIDFTSNKETNMKIF